MRPRSANARAAQATGDRLTLEIDALEAASFDSLRDRFRQLYRKPAPAGLSRDLIARLIAHRLQEKRLGKLDRALADTLDRLAQGHEPRRRLKSGTMLVREHEGVMHEVVIVPGGYLWNETMFKSLSTIARRITGTSWNGPRFFGLRSSVTDEAPHA
jgi:hypothetical protein